jgi:DNA-binding NtrC family response regulator
VVGGNPEMIGAYRTAASTAPTGANVLIRGQSGTGKELLARSVHAASGRSGPFVAVNCAAVMDSLAESELFGHERGAFTGATELRKGCFELADGGTLFLDEIGDAPLSFQAKLLRALDRGELYRVGGRDLVRPDVRLVAATNRNLEALVSDGEFRADLYYRLAEVAVRLPPLAARRGDIPALVKRLLERVGSRVGIGPVGISNDAMIHLVGSPWPGNVRELQNVLTRGALSCRGNVIEPDDVLHGCADEGRPMGVPSLQDMERQHIREALGIAGWNRGKVCDLLGITRPTLRHKMREYGIGSALSVDGSS